MEVIGLILFVLFFIFSAGNKNKKKDSAAQKPGTAGNVRQQASAANARKAQQVRQAQPVRPVRQASALPKNLDDLKAAMNQWLEDGMAEVKGNVRQSVQPAAQAAQGASMLDDAQCAGGSMPHTHDEGDSALADADCVGGSMAHTHTEGVSRAAQARRMAAIDANHPDGEDILPEAIDARALRRAVVMAEVLGKPRALRKS